MSVITNAGSLELAAGSAATIPFTVVAGRSLIVQVSYGNAITGMTGISDSEGNTWVLDYSDTSPYGHERRVYRCQTVGTPPTTITVTGSVGTLVYWFYQVTDLATSTPFEGATPVAGVSGTSHSAAFTTLTPNALTILTAVTGVARGTVTPTSGFTNLFHSRNTHLGMYNQDVGAAGSKTVTYTTSNTVLPHNLLIVYKNINTDPTVSTVTSSSTDEGSAMVFTVTLSGPTNRDTVYVYSWGGTATSADYTQALTSSMCARTGGASGNVTVSGSNITAENGVSAFTITVPTTHDLSDEVDETVVLTVGGVASTGGLITDNDAPPVVTFTDGVESFGVVTCVATLAQASGKTITFDYSTANGAKTAGTHYTSATGTLTFNPGETVKTITANTL